MSTIQMGVWKGLIRLQTAKSSTEGYDQLIGSSCMDLPQINNDQMISTLQLSSERTQSHTADLNQCPKLPSGMPWHREKKNYCNTGTSRSIQKLMPSKFLLDEISYRISKKHAD